MLWWSKVLFWDEKDALYWERHVSDMTHPTVQLLSLSTHFFKTRWVEIWLLPPPSPPPIHVSLYFLYYEWKGAVIMFQLSMFEWVGKDDWLKMRSYELFVSRSVTFDVSHFPGCPKKCHYMIKQPPEKPFFWTVRVKTATEKPRLEITVLHLPTDCAACTQLWCCN